MGELDTAEVAALLERLLAAGWQPAQLRHRVGPAQGGEPQTAELLVERLRALSTPAPSAPELRTGPACSLCDGEGAYAVTDDVQLCRRCVDVLASGRGRLADTG